MGLPAEKIELHPAYMWDCPCCGKENFERSISVEFKTLSQENKEDILEKMKLDNEQEMTERCSHLNMVPTSVKCKFCKINFNVDLGISYE